MLIGYAIIIWFTLKYGMHAMTLYSNYKEKSELIKSSRNVPIDKIEGLIIVISNDKSLPIILSNLNEWAIDLQQEINTVEVIYATGQFLQLPEALNNSENNNILKYFKQVLINGCQSFIVDGSCKFTNSLKELLPKYKNLKWVLRIEPNAIVNTIGLKKYISSLDNKYPDRPMLRAAIKNVSESVILDHRSGWFMSKKTAEDWSYLTMAFDNNTLDETPSRLPIVLGINPKDIADQHFISSSFSREDLEDVVGTMSNQCPESFLYFGSAPKRTLKLEDCVTAHFDGTLQERTSAVRQFKETLNKQIGVVMNEFTGILCKFFNNP